MDGAPSSVVEREERGWVLSLVVRTDGKVLEALCVEVEDYR
jgi:hypothetical protein